MPSAASAFQTLVKTESWIGPAARARSGRDKAKGNAKAGAKKLKNAAKSL
jgi:hypothetical protein